MRRALLTLSLLACAAVAHGAESCTVTHAGDSNLRIATWTWTAAADGTLAACAASAADMPRGTVLVVETNPGSTAPTDNYDLTLTDATSADVMVGALANRHTTTTQRAAPVLTSGTEWPAPFAGPLTLNLTNNSVDSATGTVRVFWTRH